MNVEELRDERDLLLMSLEDLEREHEAGDLPDDDYRLLRDRYTVRAARVLRALEVGEASSSPAEDARRTATTERDDSSAVATSSSSSSRRRTNAKWRRRWLGALAAVLLGVVVLSVVLVVEGTSSRLPGDTATGSISLSRQQQIQRELSQAQSLESSGDAVRALAVYHQVLQQDPTQEEALAESGWLEYQAGAQAKSSSLLSQGQDDEQKAERSDPAAFAPHLYLGSMLLVEGDYSGAVAQYKLFLSAGPPASVISTAAPFVDRAYDEDGLTPPSLP